MKRDRIFQPTPAIACLQRLTAHALRPAEGGHGDREGEASLPLWAGKPI